MKFKNDYLLEKQNLPLTIFDLGSYDVNGSYKPIFSEKKWNYYGCDIEKGPNVDIIIADAYSWDEIPDNSYDVVISGQAFEHIEYFWVTILELRRILKPGGYLCVIAPAGGNEHKYPLDCWRFYTDGFRALAKFAQLKELEIYTDWEVYWSDSVLIAQKEHNSVLDEKSSKQYELLSLIVNDKLLDYKKKTNENSLKANLYDEIISSTTWRMTKPFRGMIDKIKKVTNKGEIK